MMNEDTAKTLKLSALVERIGTADFRNGESVGLETAAVLVLDMAKAAFGENRDKDAVLLRSIAEKLTRKASDLRSEIVPLREARTKAYAELTNRETTPSA